MTALELQRALAAMPSRSAQALLFRCVEGRSAAQCAALYGIEIAQWEILFVEAARELAGETRALDDATRRALAARVQVGLEEGGEPAALIAPLRALSEHREEVHRLLEAAERAAAQSPARNREAWLRRAAVLAIIAVSLFVWIRDRDKPPEPNTRTRPARP